MGTNTCTWTFIVTRDSKLCSLIISVLLFLGCDHEPPSTTNTYSDESLTQTTKVKQSDLTGDLGSLPEEIIAASVIYFDEYGRWPNTHGELKETFIQRGERPRFLTDDKKISISQADDGKCMIAIGQNATTTTLIISPPIFERAGKISHVNVELQITADPPHPNDLDKQTPPVFPLFENPL